MRKELRETEIIEKYLQKELSEKEMKEMEEYIKENPDFAQKVEWQKISTGSLAKAKLITKIKKARKRYKIAKALKLAALLAGVVALGVASYMTYESYFNKSTKYTPNEKADNRIEAYLSKSDNVISELDVQKFKIQTDKDTVIAGEDGTTIFIPAGAFETEEKEIDFILQEAIRPADIMKAGLETYSDSNLLETGGMFMTEAYDSKGKVKLNDSSELTVDVPQNELKEGMKLYDGVKTKEGINWIKPKSIEVPLVSVDMKELNFYPPRYEKGIGINGLPLDKDYKDSLYFAFPMEKSQRKNASKCRNSLKDVYDRAIAPNFEVGRSKLKYQMHVGKFGMEFSKNDGIHGFSSMKVNSALVYEDYSFLSITWFTIEPLENLDVNKLGMSLPFGLTEPMLGKVDFPYSSENGSLGVTTYFLFQNSITEGEKLFALYLGEGVFNSVFFVLNKSKEMVDTLKNTSCPQLPPTSIQAIWNDKFNNTNLATKSFEERVKYIHLEGMESILDVYVKNINKPLWYADSIVMKMAAKNPVKFQEFFKERKGQASLKTSAKGLNKYYKKQRESLANANQTAFKKIEKKYKDLLEKQRKLKTSIKQEELKKEAMALQDEFETNLCETKKRMGLNCKNRTGRTGGISNDVSGIKRPIVRATVRSTGWKNIDRQIMEATLARESATITDPKTGKSAPLRYGMASISLSDMDSYDDIKVYLIPNGTSAYIKMDKKDGGFEKSLSEHMSYKLMVTGYKNGETFMYSDSLKWKQNIKVQLSKVEEKEINQVVLFAGKDERMEKSLLKNMQALGKLSNETNKAGQKLKSIKEIHRKMKPYIFESCAYIEDEKDVPSTVENLDDDWGFSE